MSFTSTMSSTASTTTTTTSTSSSFSSSPHYLPPLRSALPLAPQLIASLHASIEADHSAITSLELLLDSQGQPRPSPLLTPAQLCAGCTALLLLRAALCVLPGADEPMLRRVCALLRCLHRAVETDGEVGAALLPPLLAACVPLAAESEHVQQLLQARPPVLCRLSDPCHALTFLAPSTPFHASYSPLPPQFAATPLPPTFSTTPPPRSRSSRRCTSSSRWPQLASNQLAAEAGLPAALYLCSPACRLPQGELQLRAALSHTLASLSPPPPPHALPQLQRWLVAVAAAPRLPAAAAALAGHALGLAAPRRLPPPPPRRADAAVPLALHAALLCGGGGAVGRVIAALRRIGADAAAARGLGAAIDAIGAAAEQRCVRRHLAPYARAEGRGEGGGGAEDAEGAEEGVEEEGVEAEGVESDGVLAGGEGAASGEFDAPRLWEEEAWPAALAAAALSAAADPLLRACAAAAARDARLAAALLPAALHTRRRRRGGEERRAFWAAVEPLAAGEAAAAARLDVCALYFAEVAADESEGRAAEERAVVLAEEAGGRVGVGGEAEAEEGAGGGGGAALELARRDAQWRVAPRDEAAASGVAIASPLRSLGCFGLLQAVAHSARCAAEEVADDRYELQAQCEEAAWRLGSWQQATPLPEGSRFADEASLSSCRCDAHAAIAASLRCLRGGEDRRAASLLLLSSQRALAPLAARASAAGSSTAHALLQLLQLLAAASHALASPPLPPPPLPAAPFCRLEPLLALAAAVAREGGADGAYAAALLSAARHARRDGARRAAHAYLWRAQPSLPAAAAWGWRWQHAKLLWEGGGERKAEGMKMAQRLCAEMDEAAEARGEVAMHVRVLRSLGGWMEELRCESRSVIEKDFLDKAVCLAERHLGDEANAKTLLALGRFFERQYEGLLAQTGSSSFERLRSVRKSIELDLRRTKEQLAREEKRGSQAVGKLRAHMTKLARKLEADKPSSDEAAPYLYAAFDKYLCCLLRAPLASAAAAAAAAAATRLWTRHRADGNLAATLAEYLHERQLPTHAFAPLAPQLIARLGTSAAADDDGSSSSSSSSLFPSSLPPAHPSPHSFAPLLEQILTRLCAAPHAAGATLLHLLAHASPPADARRQLAVRRVLDALRLARPAFLQSVEALAAACVQFAAGEREPLLRLHQTADLSQLPLPLRRGGEGAAPRLLRFTSDFRQVGRGGSVRLSCVDEAGGKHRSLLKARPHGQFDARREALMAQAWAEVNTHLRRDARARRARLEARAPLALPVARGVALIEWVADASCMRAWLHKAHAHAVTSGRDTLSLHDCEARLSEAHARDSRGDAAHTPAAWAAITRGTRPLLHRFLWEGRGALDEWFERRLAFTTSLALGSILGWLFGLGQRSAAHLLLDQRTAALLHIGRQAILGERHAAESDTSAEAMPWRLTRELVAGLGPTGVEGLYRSSCEHTLRALQTDAASKALLTLLEAFVDEPMDGWAAARGGGAARLHRHLDAEVALLEVQRKLVGADEVGSVDAESRVQQLIQMATDESRLMRMPPSWEPWL
ncbi:hypothetical protein AB1Y20_017107 [Prymnesium parvum]|uniref:Non-specific serine/threonine protein kinase n=1 Tax=Prymnesium parvum TaxID=97485 RepID=A0AB34IBP8_PRYPA